MQPVILDLKRVQRNVQFLATASSFSPNLSLNIYGMKGRKQFLPNAKIGNCFSGTFTATVVFLIQGKELCRLLSLCKPLRALQSNPTPAPQNFSSSPPPPPPLQDTPPVISYVNHTGCPKTWNRIFPAVVSSCMCTYWTMLPWYASVINIL